MIVPGVNLLLHAHHSRSRRLKAAREWQEALMNGDGSVGLAWAVVLGRRFSSTLEIATRISCSAFSMQRARRAI